MARSCATCGTELLDDATFCTCCGIAAPSPTSADAVAAGERSNRFHVPIQHVIAACGVVLAVLAGIGLAVIDTPMPTDFAARALRSGGQTIPSSPVALAPVLPPSAAHHPGPGATAAKTAAGTTPSRAAARCPKIAVHPVAKAGTAKKPRKTQPPAILVAQLPPAAANPPSIDDQYKHIVRKKCSFGALSLLCRETVRWQLCNGRWRDDAKPGATRCYVARTGVGSRGRFNTKRA